MRKRSIITPEIEQQIIHKYVVEKKSSKQVERETGISDTEVRNIVKRAGYSVRNLVDSHKKYSMDKDFFKNIDTEEKAYILGLLFADGSHEGTIGRVSVILKAEDDLLLSRINSILKNTCPLRYVCRKTPKGKENTYCALDFHDRDVSSDLLKLGLIPNKTYNMSVPNIPQNLIKHFIRGFWDGDGNIYLAPQKNNFRGMSVAATSNRTFCEQLQKIIEQETGLIFSVRKAHSDNENIGQISLSNKSVRLFLDYLYQDATIYMTRKYNKYLEIIEWQDHMQKRGTQ